MKSSRQKPSRQTGAALLMAMLTVALVATLASAALWQQWRAIEVESAERGRVQATWILQGALDWARLILAEDGRKTLNDIGRTLRSLEKNPQQLLFGSKPTIPEYSGRP
jgi:type II secretory pathway component PulK